MSKKWIYMILSAILALLFLIVFILNNPNKPANGGTGPDSNWWMFQTDLAHTGHLAGGGPIPPLKLKWDAPLFSVTANLTPPVFGRDRIFIGSSYPDSKLYALSDQNGTVLWSYALPANTWFRWAAASANGRVYVGTEGIGSVIALDAQTGSVIWNTPMPRPPAGGIAVAFGRVYVNTFEHKVYALDQETGAVVWSSPTSTGTTTQESGASVGFGTVYVGSDDGLYTFNAATGKAGWVFPLPSPALESSAVIHYDVGVGNPGLVMIGTNDKTLYAINANNGSRVWSYTANTPQGFRNVVVAEKRAFINDFTAITALDGNTGTLIWTQPTVNFSTNSPAVSNGILYYMEAATVRGIRTSNGQMVWDAPIPGNGNAVANGNSMAIDRGLLIVPNSGHVYAFGQ